MDSAARKIRPAHDGFITLIDTDAEAESAPQTIGERTMLCLAAEYIKQIEELAGAITPRTVDEITFACLMLCQDYGIRPTAEITRCITACREVSANEIEKLPWDLMASCIEPQVGSESFDKLQANLSVGRSARRAYMLDLAYFLRCRMSRKATDELLKNVSDTVAYWENSLGLCAYFYDEINEIWAVAESYIPEHSDAIELYQDRLKWVKQRGIGVCTYYFASLEKDVRKVILDIALRLQITQE
jgi:hypothetical protein